LPIYYINLASRLDRRDFMDRQFSMLGLTAARVEAITPAELMTEEWGRRADGKATVPEPAVCCGLSHLKALRQMIAEGQRWGVVMEDDVELSPRFRGFLAAFEQRSPHALIVRLETAHIANLTMSPSVAEYAGATLHRYTGWERGAAGYLVSQEGAKLILADARPRLKEIDVQLFFDTSSLCRHLRPLQANPALCIQVSNRKQHAGRPYVSSDLMPARTERPSPLRMLAKALHRDVVLGGKKAWRRAIEGAVRMRVPYAEE